MSTKVLTEVPLGASTLDRFEPLIGEARTRGLLDQAARARDRLAGRTFWNLNSTAKGGGVAEMLACQLPYLRGAGVDARWLVLDGDEEFFTVSKRIHNMLHGDPGDGGGLGGAARDIYERTSSRNAAELATLVAPGDVVLLHDPQTAGLAHAATEAGAGVAWRCHVGADEPNRETRSAWRFLREQLDPVDCMVFTSARHVWEGLDGCEVRLIEPSIDPFTPKNQALDEDAVRAILVAAGLLEADGPETAPRYCDSTGDEQLVRRRASVLPGPVPRGAPVVLQVSRWDELKDHAGVLEGFVLGADAYPDAHLVLAGPSVDGVADDPEQAEVLADVRAAWEALGPALRGRVHIALLPMHDEEENAAMVNALQRYAAVIVQKSIAEGFGLTVAEAMWKARPVVASARGGIVEQVIHGTTGLLLDDPEDPRELAAALRTVLCDPDCAARLAGAAHTRVRDDFLTPRELGQLVGLADDLVDAPAR